MSEKEVHRREESGTRIAVLAALFGNLGVAIVKLVAWFFSGSSAMLAESLHSLADTMNQIFLLVGLKLEKRRPTVEHPFGFGRERYFWAFVVAVSIFVLGAVFSIYEGVHKILHPAPIQNAAWAFVALGFAAVFETFALRIAWREFCEWRKRNPGSLWHGLCTTKRPTILVVLFEDSAALLGILAAAIGIGLATLTEDSLYDGLASLVIGMILLGAAWFIGWRTRGLLLGEAAGEADRARIREAVVSVDAVVELVEMLTLHLGPQDILVNLSVNFRDELSTDEVERAVDAIESRIRAAVPEARRIFIEAESLVRRGEPAG